MIKVIRYNSKLPEGFTEINTTSRSTNWTRELSPFLLGPCDLWGGYISKNMENAWQYSKVYDRFVGPPIEISTTCQGLELGPELFLYSKWLEWAQEGWNKQRADRYPMGRGAKPKFSYWNGKFLNYIEARKEIYIPLYTAAVIKTEAFEILQRMVDLGENIALRDFDGYDRKDQSWEEVINNPNKKMGHAFVIAMLLEGYLD